jgi:hypothetical protein
MEYAVLFSSFMLRTACHYLSKLVKLVSDVTAYTQKDLRAAEKLLGYITQLSACNTLDG